jgi:transcriptional regulator with XRE-family HTH domain
MLRIKHLRLLRELSQREVANRTDIPPAHLCYFESGRMTPRPDELVKLGTFFNARLNACSITSRRQVSVKQPGLDNHAMGTIFEELVRRFNEENNEEAGEHWTPRDAVKLMARLIFLPIADLQRPVREHHVDRRRSGAQADHRGHPEPRGCRQGIPERNQELRQAERQDRARQGAGARDDGGSEG